MMIGGPCTKAGHCATGNRHCQGSWVKLAGDQPLENWYQQYLTPQVQLKDLKAMS